MRLKFSILNYIKLFLLKQNRILCILNFTKKYIKISHCLILICILTLSIKSLTISIFSVSTAKDKTVL